MRVIELNSRGEGQIASSGKINRSELDPVGLRCGSRLRAHDHERVTGRFLSGTFGGLCVDESYRPCGLSRGLQLSHFQFPKHALGLSHPRQLVFKRWKELA